jgi:hypothetical protein
LVSRGAKFLEKRRKNVQIFQALRWRFDIWEAIFAVKTDGILCPYLLLLDQAILLNFRSSIDRPLNGYLRTPVVITISVSRKKIYNQSLGALEKKLFWMKMLCTTYTNVWSIICPLEVRCLTPLSKIFHLLLLWRK